MEHLIIASYYKIKYGKRVYIIYSPVLGFFSKFKISEEKYKDTMDTMGFYKHLIREKPEVEFVLSLNGIGI